MLETVIWVMGIILLVSVVFALWSCVTYVALKADRDSYKAANEFKDEELKKLIHQKKSSEVRLGKIGENLAPFTEQWPWDPNDFRFLGSPIDGIQFTEDMIYLVEIKTGKSRLSKKQTRCKELVKAGKVTFMSYRIDVDGISKTLTPMSSL